MALRTPLYDWHVAHHGRMVDFAGWDMPVQYSSIVEEHTAVRTAAGLFDISHMGRLVFDGPDAVAFLQHVFTNDVATMKPGQIRYGLLCNDEGGVLDDVLVYRLEPFWMMVVNASNRPKVLDWFGKQVGGRQVKVIDRTTDWGMLALQGPRAVDVATALVSDRLPGLKNYYGEARVAGGDVRIVSRTGYTGEDGCEVIVPAGDVVALADRLTDPALEGKFGCVVRPCGLGARDTLRLEAAMPLYGHELDEQTDPYQAGLSWAVKPAKGDFVGRAALERRRENGSLPRRIGLEVEGKRVAREGAAVLAQGRPVGRVSSGTFAPTLQKAIAMAYVEPACCAIGTDLEVDVRGKPAPARVVPLPFYQRPRS